MPSRKSKSKSPIMGWIVSFVAVITFLGGILMVVRNNEIYTLDRAIEYGSILGTDFTSCAGTIFGFEARNCEWDINDSGSGSGLKPPSRGDNTNSGGSGNEARDFFGETGNAGNIDTGESAFGGNFGTDYSLDFFEVLEDIEVNDNPPNTSDVDYDRSEWRHWIGSPCNTRQEVLIEQGSNVETGDRCRITAGEWLDPFTGSTTQDSSSLDIDHIVPLGYAAIHGGSSWDNSRKEVFANDIANLRAVSASENRKKGADGPADYMPPNSDYHCEYAQIWVSILDDYDLSTTAKDKNSLRGALETC